MSELNIKDLHVNIGEKEILKGVTLSIQQGQVHAIMDRTAPVNRLLRTRSWVIPVTR